MKMATIDGVKLILEMIFGDHYLKTYMSLRFKDLHIGQPIAEMVSDFAQFRNSIVKEKVDAGKEKDGKTPKITEVQRTITLQ